MNELIKNITGFSLLTSKVMARFIIAELHKNLITTLRNETHYRLIKTRNLLQGVTDLFDVTQGHAKKEKQMYFFEC